MRHVMASVACVSAILTAMPASSGQLYDELGALLATHPQIQSKQKATLSAEEGIRAARAGYLPTVRVTGDAGPEYVDSPARRETNAGEASYTGRETAGITVTQRLFDGYLTNSQVDSAKIARGISGSDLRFTRQAVLQEATGAYISVLRYTKLIALSRQNERKIQEQLNLEDERVQKGSGIASDVLAAKQRLQIAKERRVQFEGGFEDAASTYIQVFGTAPNVTAMSDPPIPAALMPASLDEALEAAEKENPSLETASRTVELTGERRRTAEAGYYPTLNLVGQTNYEHDKNATPGTRRDVSLLMVANWELFSGFRTDAQVAQATIDHAASKDNQMHAGRKIGEAVRRSWHKLKVARERTELLANAAILAEEVWSARVKQREAGKATVQEVLDEETRINDARINYTMAYYDALQASYEVLAAVGRLELDAVAGTPPATPAIAPSTRSGAAPASNPLIQPISASTEDLTAIMSRVQTLMDQSGSGLNPGRHRR